jgi:Ca-activated chloride channel family protein
VLALAWSAPAASAEVSPSEVLRQADEKVGTTYVSAMMRRGPRDQQQQQGEDKALSPYFYVQGGNPETERLPLKETSAKVNIAGVIAKVKVKQVFENSGDKPIEAVYVFPASTRAAVHGMRMKIGSRTVEAKIERKAEARAQYEQAKAEGKRASLLEQERPNVFTMNVANVMPKDRIEVELDYSELLVPEDSVYEFVYPTVVGPRYGGGADPAKDKWIANPYLEEGKKEPYRFDIEVHVETGIPLKELGSPSHKVVVNYLSKASADVRLQESGGGNKDYVLRYRLAGDKIESGVLLWKGEKGENFFLAMLEPPQRPTQAQIPPREYIFLLDVSGSMHGYPLDTAKVLAKDLFGQLRPTDFFNVVTFSGGHSTLSPEGSLPATPGNVQMATEAFNRQRGGGGTELAAGLRAAYAIPKKAQGVARSVIVVTDGYVGVESQTYKFVREHLNEASCFAFGIGSAVNRGLIEGLARAGQGEPFVVLGPDKAKAEADQLKKYIESPVLAGIQATFPGFEAREVAPMKVPDLLASRPVVLFGKFKGEPKGKIVVSGFAGGGKYEAAIDLKPEMVKAENAPIRWLWARKWVAFLDDELKMTAAKEIEDAITDLGLSYTLLTTFTSFVAVDSEVANRSGQPADKVNQPLPMPEGVSNNAVAGPAPAQALAGGAAGFGGLGLQGTGTGGGGRASAESKSVRSEPAPMTVAPSAPPPPPMANAAPAPARKASKAQRSFGDEMERDASGAVRLAIVDLKATGIGDTRALLAEIDKVLQSAGDCASAASVRLRLTVDKAGKVLRIEVVTGDAKLGACLQGKLKGLSSASLSEGATGTLEIVVKPIG